MTTTTQIREWWSPACKGPFVKVELHGEGAVSVNEKIIPAVLQLNAQLKKHNYLTRLSDTGAYNCRTITGGTGYSLHAYGIALDLNWRTNPYGPTLVTDMPPAMIADIKAIKTRNGKQVWRWGGNYSGNKDAMHFEIIVSPADLATGIATPSTPTTPSTPKKEEDMPSSLWALEGYPHVYVVPPSGDSKTWIPNPAALEWGKALMSLGGHDTTIHIAKPNEASGEWLQGLPEIRFDPTLAQIKETFQKIVDALPTTGGTLSETKIREILNEEFGFLKPGF